MLESFFFFFFNVIYGQKIVSVFVENFEYSEIVRISKLKIFFLKNTFRIRQHLKIISTVRKRGEKLTNFLHLVLFSLIIYIAFENGVSSTPKLPELNVHCFPKKSIIKHIFFSLWAPEKVSFSRDGTVNNIESFQSLWLKFTDNDVSLNHLYEPSISFP